MSPPKRDTSGTHEIPLEVQVAVLVERVGTLCDRLEDLPCKEHAERWAKLSAEVQQIKTSGGGVPAWLRDWRLLLPIALVALGVPQVRACMGEERARAVEAAVRKLEAAPPQTKVMVTPMPQPIVIKPDAER